MSLPRALGAALALALWLTAPAAGQNNPSFEGIGDLSGGAAESAALAVSRNGTTVVGSSEGSNGTEAVRWTFGGGLVGLGQASTSDPFSEATGVSDNGSVIAGTAVNSSGGRAFRWTSGGGYTFLGTFSCTLCDPATTGEGISGDGQTVVGSGLEYPLFGDPRVNPARWPGGGTGISNLGDLPGGGDAGTALDASTNGAVIVGETDSGAGPSGFYWTSGSGIQAVPGLPGMLFRTGGLAIAGDASAIVGYANASASGTNQLEPVRWTGAGYATIENLGSLPGQGAARGRAFDVTPDGGIIVGSTRNPAAQDVAFVWDAASGMRELSVLLAEEYGVDVGDWVLQEARGVSEVNGAGEFVVVGTGLNPAGDPEGWVAVLSPTACNDGLDNDSDTDVDFPADPGCTSLGDRSEGPDCSDGLDNDGDGQSDLSDPDCTGAADQSELPDCGNGLDDDGDGEADYPADPGCRGPASQSESPECDDGVDNDGDLLTDASDPECLDPSDTSERLDCGDGADNDGDGLVDLLDPDCDDAADPSEDPACSDFVDNDGEGRTDYPAAYPRCSGPQDATEEPECGDGEDNDADLATDFPDDAECTGPLFDVEAPGSVTAGDLLVVDRGPGVLYAMDPGTGAERLLSQGAALVSPEGVAVRGDGRIVVTTPSGALEVDPTTGRQELRSGPFVSQGGLPVEVDSQGDLVVLDNAGIQRIAWNPSGVGASTQLLTIPVGTNLGFFTGFTLLLEDDDTALTTGFGLLGDGVFRADLAAGTVSKVTPGFQTHSWRDLAFESPGTVLAVGIHASQGEGVYRVDTTTGAVSTLTNDPAWQHLDGVAVGAGGDVYVADSGDCDESGCTGGLVAHVDPGSGARSVLRAGIFSGTLELAVAGAPPPACSDGIDNDGDGLLDGADAGCSGPGDASEHDPALVCDNGLDDDSDGLPDWPSDPGCRDSSWTLENPQCDDDLNNDNQTGIDWDGGSGGGAPDPQCLNQPWKNKERKSGCGLGFELALLIPLGRLARRARSRS